MLRQKPKLENNLKEGCMDCQKEEFLILDPLVLKLTPARITSRQIESARRCISVI